MKPSAILAVLKSNYQGLANLGNLVIGNMTGNANFTTPAPALATLTTSVSDLEAAIAAWGPVGNRGSHAQLLDLRSKALIVYNQLLAEAQYVTNTASLAAAGDYVLMAAIIATSGFGVKNPPVPQGLLGAPQNLHRMFTDNVSLYTPRLKWKKPIGLNSPNNVKSYQILRSPDNNILNASVIATSTKTSFIDVTAPSGADLWYWVKGVNSEGPGAESNVLNTQTAV